MVAECDILLYLLRVKIFRTCISCHAGAFDVSGVASGGVRKDEESRATQGRGSRGGRVLRNRGGGRRGREKEREI